MVEKIEDDGIISATEIFIVKPHLAMVVIRCQAGQP
jgi:hypothetical protein